MNTIASLGHHEGMSIDDAVARVLELHNSVMEEFNTLASNLLRSELASDAVALRARPSALHARAVRVGVARRSLFQNLLRLGRPQPQVTPSPPAGPRIV